MAAYVLAINAVAFAIYGWDKGVAKVLGWLKLKDSLPLRVPENLLIWGLAFPGGIVGAVAAMVAFNHKIGSKEKADQFRIELLQAGALFTGALLIILLLVTATGIDVLVILDGIIASFVHVVLGMLGVLWSLVEQVVL